jgi:hypothetical protein
MKRIIKIFSILIILISTSCDPHYPFYIVNNSQDTLFMLIHYDKRYLDSSEVNHFDQRFEKIFPNDSLRTLPSLFSDIWENDHFLIIIQSDTLKKYSTFENVVSLKKYKEFYYSKDTLNSIKKLVITDEMLH